MAELPDFVVKLLQVLKGIRAGAERDVLLYNGPIDRNGFFEVCQKAQPKNEILLLILTTSGGDPHAAFRIARVLGERYKRIEALIGGPCKSAGTLVVMGADEVIIADEGELGPLDIQLRRPDEPLEAESGLDVVTSLNHLTASALSAWESAFVEIQADSQLSTKACADLANNLISELYGKLFTQIDPVRLGAVIRANTIATRYGTSLAETKKNLKTNAVQHLVVNYPAHGYAIDRAEARKLFTNIREPSPEELNLLKSFEEQVLSVRRVERERLIWRLDTLLGEAQTENDGQEHDRPGAPPGTAEPAKGRDGDDAPNAGSPAAHQPSHADDKPSAGSSDKPAEPGNAAGPVAASPSK